MHNDTPVSAVIDVSSPRSAGVDCLALWPAAASRPRHVDRADDVLCPKPARSSACSLRVGQDLLGDPLPRDPALINQFVFEDADRPQAVVGRDGADPAGFVRVAAPGLLVIGYRSNPSAVELPAEKFNQYLKEEGLDAIAALRARRNETGAQGPRASFRAAPRAWCFRARRARRRAIGRSALRSNSWPNEIRTRCAPARTFRCA